MMRRALLVGLLLGAVGLAGTARAQALQPPPAPGLRTAAFAGGCFWCMEQPFEKLDGVTEVVSGYTGGTVANPTYRQVGGGRTGHKEAVQVTYDPARVTYERLLDVFWRNVDPLDAGGQFCDRGEEYATAVYTGDAEQRDLAERSRAAVRERLGRPVATEIVDAGPFYRAEDYHQDYAATHPIRYRYYRYTCGRDARLRQLWGDEAGGQAVAGR